MRCAKRAIGPPIPPAAYPLVAGLLASFVAEASTEASTATLIARSSAVTHELGGTCVGVSLAFTIQSRNVRDFSTSLDQVSRLRREGITTDKRSRALRHLQS